MSNVVNFKTREPHSPHEPRKIMSIEDLHAHTRQQRVLKNFLIDAETLGIRWTDVRSWLVNALAYVDARIVQQQNRSK